jgi:hypothetical protein
MKVLGWILTIAGGFLSFGALIQMADSKHRDTFVPEAALIAVATLVIKDKLKTSEPSSEVITLNGMATGITVDVPFNFENQNYLEHFLCTEMTDAFDRINEESGIQIHGILCNHFFLKHGWILDFDKVTAHKQ